MSIAYDCFNKLLSYLKGNSNEARLDYSYDKEATNQVLILHDAVSYMNKVYESADYKDFVLYCFVAKKYERKLNLLNSIIIFIGILLAALLYLLTKKTVIVIIVLILLFIILAIIKIITKGKDYNSFYKETMKTFFENIIPYFNVSFISSDNISNDWFKKYILKTFDNYYLNEQKSFSNEYCNGDFSLLKLERITKSKDSEGNIKDNKSIVFDGFYYNINYNNPFKLLNGSVIEIREDDSVLSRVAEDTRQSIYQSDREFMFNIEELNKSLDCHIKGVNNHGDIDDMMMEMHKFITPTFEDRLMFLKTRFNSFNMTISDNNINVTINMNRSFFQKARNGDSYIGRQYKDYFTKSKFPTPTLTNANDFMYYNVFPIVEQLFYIIYLDDLMRIHSNNNNSMIENIPIIEEFEKKELELAEMKYTDFKKIYKEEIEQLFLESKELEIKL